LLRSETGTFPSKLEDRVIELHVLLLGLRSILKFRVPPPCRRWVEYNDMNRRRDLSL